MRNTFIFCLISLFIFSGCSWFKAKPEKSAQELATDGMKNFNDGKYKKAIGEFEKIKNWYPFSKYAILAELKLADSHYNIKEYNEAAYAYEEFENLHPRNEAIPYVIFQHGSCYFAQMDKIDRDQTPAKKAFDIFSRLITSYPESEHAKKAKANSGECLKNLAEHEFYIGQFYYKSKHYKAALSRFNSLISNYPGVDTCQKAKDYISLCEVKLRESEQAKSIKK